MSKEKWSFNCGSLGSRVRTFERKRGGTVYVSAYDANWGGPKRRATGIKVRGPNGRLIPASVRQAEEEAIALSHALATGGAPQADPTVGEAIELFRREVVVDAAGKHRADLNRYLKWLREFLGPEFILSQFGLRDWSTIVRDRLTGTLDHAGRRVHDPEKRRPVSPRTVQKLLKTVRQLCRFATHYRLANGAFLLEFDPTRGLKLPRVVDPARPVATDERLEKLLEVAHAAHPYLPHLLILASATGRRISSILALRYSDWLPDRGTYGSIRWRAQTDKLNRESIVPVAPAVRDAILAIQAERPGLGEAFLFPAPRSEGPVDVCLACQWLRRAEKLAEIPHIKQGAWHMFRRAFATKRKFLPLKDVAAAGGWLGTQTLQQVYQHADIGTLEAVVLGGSALVGVVGQDEEARCRSRPLPGSPKAPRKSRGFSGVSE